MIDTYKKFISPWIFLCLISCASTTRLPANIMFIEPSPDINPNLSAFLGVWEGKWYSSQDVTLVIESVNNNYAEVIFSVGINAAGGIYPQDSFYYVRGEMISDKAFGWTTANNNRFIFEMQEGFKEIKGYFIESPTGAKINATLIRTSVEALKNVTVHKYPYVAYVHPAKSNKDFDYDNNLCLREAEKQTTLLSPDIRRYQIWEEVNRCLRDDHGWKPVDNNSKADVRF